MAQLIKAPTSDAINREFMPQPDYTKDFEYGIHSFPVGARLRSGSVLLVKANMLACYPLAKALNEIFCCLSVSR